jgi:CBS domain-containing protein
MANAAFWFGLISGLSDKHKNLSQEFEFETALSNFHSAARYGLAAQFEWFGGKTIPAQELIVKELLPIAREGLKERLDHADSTKYLDVIEERVSRGQTGSRWVLRSMALMKEKGSPAEHLGALTAAMVDRQKEGTPVSKWEPARLEETGGWTHNYLRVEQYMTTDLFTVQEDESIDFVSQLMDWNRIRHIPVEDQQNRLVGLVSYRQILQAHGNGKTKTSDPTPISEVMRKELYTVTPETKTLDAIRIMRQHKVGCLPVVHKDRLVGIVTERDFMNLARDLMEEALSDDDATSDE